MSIFDNSDTFCNFISNNTHFVMYKIATIALIVLLLSIPIDSLFAQNITNDGKSTGQFEFQLTKQDSILALSIPKLKLSNEYKEKNGRDLPTSLNNAKLSFFRPIFSQETYPNCGQSAGVGYNFTYEINQARGLSANMEANQYTPQFTWNFMNGGDGWFGVSYFHSFEVLKKVGNPSIEEYGGMYYGGETRWMSGFESYYNSMFNRIEDVYSIDVSTEEGINTLKYWLYDHLEGEETGGVASFYAASPWNLTTLPNDSPEAGKHVIEEWLFPASHAMTIVGYDDSISFDYNEDGEYTNDVDINGDKVVDLKDWEMGGFLFANSYGNNWADSGFCYVMYNAFGHKYGEGGVWNQSVNVLKVKSDYDPVLGLKLKLKHNSRNKLKIIAGISSDTTLNYPIHTIDFPIVNFQGGNNLLQGIDSLSNADELELELDITNLLTNIEPGALAKYFVRIVERDPANNGNGQILFFSLIDHSNNDNETIFSEVPFIIENNGITQLSLVKQIQFDKVSILTEELQGFEPDIPYGFQLEAVGGEQPYRWSLLKDYKIGVLDEEFPNADGEELQFSNPFGFVSIELPFLFPFYGDTVNQISIYIDGFVTFEDRQFPYPYFIGESTMLVNNNLIAAFMTDLRIESSLGQKVTVDANDEYFLIKWKVSIEQLNGNTDIIFALKIFPSGEIVTYFDNMEIPDDLLWTSGISDGDNMNYVINSVSDHAIGKSEKSFIYNPLVYSSNEVSISPTGELEALVMDDTKIYQLKVGVTDDQSISAFKQFQLSSGLLLNYEISSGYNDKIDYTELASIKAIVKNISTSSIEDIQLNYMVEDDYINIIEEVLDVGTLDSGETKEVDSSLVFFVSENVPDQHIIKITNSMNSNDKSWQLNSLLTANAPNFIINEIEINGLTWIEPGSTDQVNFHISNSGHASARTIEVRFFCDNEYIEIVGSDTQNIDELLPNGDYFIDYVLKASNQALSGTIVPCKLKYYKDNSLLSESDFNIQIGQTPVLLVDLDPNHTSVTDIKDDLDAIELNYEVSNAIPMNLSNYKSVFVLLGTLFTNHELSYSEGMKLSEYLYDGGSLYMEGRVTWTQQQTPIHSMFSINVLGGVNYFIIDTIYTINIDTVEQKIFEFVHNKPYSNYYLVPVEEAITLFQFSKSDSACVVANKTDEYNTIASIIEYGSLVDIDTSFTKNDYLHFITSYFGLYESTTGTYEFDEESLEDEVITAYPNPFTDNITIQFQFQNTEPFTLQIFDQLGRLVYLKDLSNISYISSVYKLNWNGHDLNGQITTKGIYCVRLVSGNQSYSIKAVRL